MSPAPPQLYLEFFDHAAKTEIEHEICEGVAWAGPLAKDRGQRRPLDLEPRTFVPLLYELDRLRGGHPLAA